MQQSREMSELASEPDPELAGIDPHQPCDFPPGSLEKVMVLAKRYEDGVWFWNRADRLDHEGLSPGWDDSEEEEDWDE